MKRSIFSLPLVLLVAVFSLAGCNQANNGSDDQADQNQTESNDNGA